MNTREAAERWLIEHNHHGCHVSDLDLPADTPMPLPADVDSLAALLDSASVVDFDEMPPFVWTGAEPSGQWIREDGRWVRLSKPEK